MSTSSENTLSSEFVDMARKATKREFIASMDRRTFWNFDNRLRARPDQEVAAFVEEVAAFVEEDAALVESILQYGITSENHDFRSSSWKLLRYMAGYSESYVPDVLFFDRVLDALNRVCNDLNTTPALWKDEWDYKLGHKILIAAAKKAPFVLFFPFDDIEKLANKAENPVVRLQSQITFGVFVELRPDLVTEPMVRREEHTVDYYEDKNVRKWARTILDKMYEACPEYKPSLPKRALNGVRVLSSRVDHLVHQ